MSIASDNRGIAQGERLVRVEEQMTELRDKVDRMDKKLDALLDLRSKGMGILWVLSGIGFVAVELLHRIWK